MCDVRLENRSQTDTQWDKNKENGPFWWLSGRFSGLFDHIPFITFVKSTSDRIVHFRVIFFLKNHPFASPKTAHFWTESVRSPKSRLNSHGTSLRKKFTCYVKTIRMHRLASFLISPILHVSFDHLYFGKQFWSRKNWSSMWSLWNNMIEQ